MTKTKLFNQNPKYKALYHALMKSILEDEDAMDKGVADELKKRKPDDADKDEGPTAGLDRGLNRQNTDYAKHDDAEFNNTDMPMGHGEDLGKTNEQLKDEVVPKNDWYKKSRSDPPYDFEWNKGKLVDDGPEQSWLNDMANATKPPLTFDELMHTPIYFPAIAMNCLKIDRLTKEHLVGPAYNLLKGTCKSYAELEYTMEECYRALSEQLDWNNPKGHCCPYDLTKPLLVQMSSQGRQIISADFFFNNDLEYIRGGSNDKKYTASTTKSKAARTIIQARVKDLQLGVESYQKKLNLTKPRTRDVDMSRRPAYTTLSNPQVHDTLDQMLHELHLMYNKAMRRGLRGRPQTAPADNMTLSYFVLLFQKDSILQAGNHVNGILLKLNLPDHRSILIDSKIHIKMDMEVPGSSRFKDS
uniref:Uncharacterized protein n=1 Tax=Tanacetum cinerariifolium TaxID=118510 RepID=A0A6L2MAS1_TANCI|nr:hypothetical protein [Tanacetum cinerariifolium]